jgi:hypothetical protein
MRSRVFFWSKTALDVAKYDKDSGADGFQHLSFLNIFCGSMLNWQVEVFCFRGISERVGALLLRSALKLEVVRNASVVLRS